MTIALQQETLLQELLDRQAIRDTLVRYCRGVDRCDADLIASTYRPDAIDEHSHNHFTGETAGPAIVEANRKNKASMHHITNQAVAFHGDGRAGVETYFSCWQVENHDGEEKLFHALGRYVDRFERRDGEWKIAHRVVVIERTRYLAPDGDTPRSRLGLDSRDHGDPSYAVLEG